MDIVIPDSHRLTKLEIKLLHVIQLLLRERAHLLRVRPKRGK